MTRFFLSLLLAVLFSAPVRAQGQAESAQRTRYPGKYILASLVLPGAGEMWQGNKIKGEIFLWTDAAIWLTYGGLTTVGGLRNQDAKLFARCWSGANPYVRSDDYYVAVERYWNSDQYNEDVRRDAREMYPQDPDKQKAYAAAHSYTGDKAWSWGSDSLQNVYRDRRQGARTLGHTAAFFLGAALLNRLASAIDVAFFTPRPEPGSSIRASRRLAALPTLDKPGLALVYRF